MPSHPIELSPLGQGSGGQSTASLPPPYRDQVPPPPRRDPDTVPGGLGSGYRRAEDLAKASVRHSEEGMDSASFYGLVAAGWFALLALPALVFPRFILFMAQGSEAQVIAGTKSTVVPSYDRSHFDALTALESFLLRMLGFGLLSLAAIVVFTVVPSYSPPAPSRSSTITVMAVLGCVTAVIGWNAPLGALSTLLGLGNGVIGAWGWWTLFFGEETHKFRKYLKKDSRMKRL